MPVHTEAERKKKRRRRPRGQTNATNDVIAASQDQLAALLQQRGQAIPAPANQPAAPVEPQAPSLASRARVAGQVAIPAALAAGQQIRQLPGRVGSAVGNALIPDQAVTAQETQQRDRLSVSPINQQGAQPDDFLQLTPENQAELESQITSRARGRQTAVAQARADREAQPTNPFDVAVNRVLNDPNTAPFNAPPGVLRAAEEAAGGPIALGKRFAASRHRQRLQDLAASSETLEVRNGRLRPREDIVAQAQEALGTRRGRPQTAEERTAAVDRATKRRGDRATAREVTKQELRRRALERRRANIEAGGSVRRLRQQEVAAAERSRLIGVEEGRVKAEQIAAAAGDPKLLAALARSDPALAQIIAQQRGLIPVGVGAPQAEPGSPAANRNTSRLDSAENYRIEAGTQATQTGMQIAGDVGSILSDLNDTSFIRGDVKTLPRVNRRITQSLEAVGAMPKGPERDALIDSLITTMREAIPQLRVSQVEPFNRLLNGLKALKSKTTRARDQSRS